MMLCKLVNRNSALHLLPHT